MTRKLNKHVDLHSSSNCISKEEAQPNTNPNFWTKCTTNQIVRATTLRIKENISHSIGVQLNFQAIHSNTTNCELIYLFLNKRVTEKIQRGYGKANNSSKFQIFFLLILRFSLNIFTICQILGFNLSVSHISRTQNNSLICKCEL